MKPGRKRRDFWEYAQRVENGCWLWVGATTTNRRGVRHGTTSIGGRTIIAYRHAWQLSHGRSPGKRIVKHTCDNRRCVNPAHLRLGTHLQNMREMRVRGRQCRGERCHSSVLTPARVKSLRALWDFGVPSSTLASMFDISKTSALKAAKGLNWRHV